MKRIYIEEILVFFIAKHIVMAILLGWGQIFYSAYCWATLLAEEGESSRDFFSSLLWRDCDHFSELYKWKL